MKLYRKCEVNRNENGDDGGDYNTDAELMSHLEYWNITMHFNHSSK